MIDMGMNVNQSHSTKRPICFTIYAKNYFTCLCNEPVSRAGSFVTPSGLLSQSSLGDDGFVSTARFLRAVISSVWLPPALLPFFPGSHSRGNTIAFTRQIKPQAEAPPVDKEGTLRITDWLEADRTRKAEVRVHKIMEEDQDFGARFSILLYQAHLDLRIGVKVR
ncbi:hypothetical protein T07_2384 [Trichinella nelsoni]|uniref:Uncharacterized protein n=1 Tax=Trichinella nelsoni TaxID=6336 RepID=A0A0V0RSE1_9BILA|nr:hypothetical protein T07_2384 [Trichinella nelsoni]